MADRTIEELRGIKDGMALEHGNDVRKIAAYLGSIHPDDASASSSRSVVDILAEAPGHRLFKTAKEVDDYIKEEKASWDR